MHILSWRFERVEQDVKDEFNRKNKDAYRKFNVVEARKWAREANGKIRYQANRRRHDTI